ncbi:hypothetical protein JZ751_020698 [Albula glossodonta]|uniref:Uncharacterized protein n=1 Tax=Albula glossodonta TaxID=121402 RepID=A0A8T2PIG7_9TELE|nr:hypothetical protein JZ751_020698 [Albula glossodonta]
MEVRRMACPGLRLSCQMKIENSLWTATEEQHIFIYSLKDMCPLSHPQKELSCPAVVTCLFTVPAKKETLALVFVGMADGLVAVYTLVNDMPLEGETYLCSHSLNKSVFHLEDDDPRQKPYPVRSMVLVRSGSEVWYTNGPGLLVIDCISLRAVRRLDPYLHPSTVVSLASCSSGGWGEEAVWCLDDHTNTLLMYHAASYQLCASYHCGDANPLRDTFAIQRPAGVELPPPPALFQELDSPTEEPSPGEVTILYSEETGTQIIHHQDSLTDYCSMSSSSISSEQLGHMGRSSSGALSSLASSGSTPFSTDCEDGDRLQGDPSPAEPLQSHTPPHQQIQTPPHLQAHSILAVRGTLWIPRRGGDVMVIELQQQGGLLRGRVIAVLSAPGLGQYGTLVEAALVAKDAVVCGFRNENMEWCLAVWRGWGARELEIFYQSYEELGRLETSMRKRRAGLGGIHADRPHCSEGWGREMVRGVFEKRVFGDPTGVCLFLTLTDGPVNGASVAALLQHLSRRDSPTRGMTAAGHNVGQCSCTSTESNKWSSLEMERQD